MFSLLPPAFAVVPQYFVHITVVPKPLSEPDKRISHTYGSSVSHSVSLPSTTWVQVFADSHGRPVQRLEGMSELLPGVAFALALAVEPFEQDVFCAIVVVVTPCRIIRDGIVVQVPGHASPCLPDHLPFTQYPSNFGSPFRELAETLTQLLTAGAAFNLEVTFAGLPTIVREPQEGKVFWFAATSLRILPGKAPKLDALRFLFSQFQPELLEPSPTSPVLSEKLFFQK